MNTLRLVVILGLCSIAASSPIVNDASRFRVPFPIKQDDDGMDVFFKFVVQDDDIDDDEEQDDDINEISGIDSFFPIGTNNMVQNAPLVISHNYAPLPIDQNDDINENSRIDNIRYIKYDIRPKADRMETLSFEDFNEEFQENGFYQFKDFNKKFLINYAFPTLFVYQPDEDVPELHGYYFEKAGQSFINENKVYSNLVQYQPFYKYFAQGDHVSGFTPAATRLVSPEFFDYKLTKFVHVEEVAPEFSVVFVIPNEKGLSSFRDELDITNVNVYETSVTGQSLSNFVFT